MSAQVWIAAGEGMAPGRDSVSVVAGLEAIAHRYSAVLVDLWGVIHDGEKIYPGVRNALRRLRESGTVIFLLSNSARRAAEVKALLARMGLAPPEYDHVMTSGELTFEALQDPPDPWHAALGAKFLPIGPFARNGSLTGTNRSETEDVEGADFVLNTGTDEHADMTSYKSLLDACAVRGLPMVCANPDLTVMVGDRTVACAGTLALYYEEIGGDVRYHGKPHASVYRTCLDKLGLDRSKVLAIGDALRTDIAGANAAGLDSALITSGIHCSDLDMTWGSVPSSSRILALVEKSGHRPTFAMSTFRW